MKHFTNFKALVIVLAITATSMNAIAQKFSGLTANALTGTAAAAVDNNMGTRWESAFEDPQWITIDLGEEKTVGAIKIYWEGANAKNYSISFSSNGTDFNGELSYTDKAAGSRTDIIDNLNINCRYIKMNGTARNLTYGYSIWEFEVYPPVAPVLTSLSITPAKSSIKLGETKQLTVTGLDQLENPFELTAATNWSVDGTGATVDANGLFSSTQKGLFTVTATNSDITKTATVDVLPTNDNIAIGATATASAGNATQAIDNNDGTRWESAFEDPQWIMVDFGTKKHITDIIISWEAANSKDYVIEISDNGTDWSNLITKTEMAGGLRTDRIYDLDVNAQYVKLTGTARNLTYGHSIWEFKIFGNTNLSTLWPKVNSEKTIQVFPNPAKDQLNFSSEIQSVSIYNMQGQLLATKSNISKLDVSDIEKGIYLLRISDKMGNNQVDKIEIR